jgi:hypothetical protein
MYRPITLFVFIVSIQSVFGQIEFEHIRDVSPGDMDVFHMKHVYGGDVLFIDIDGDLDLDAVTCGYDRNDNATTDVYLNIDSLGTYRPIADVIVDVAGSLTGGDVDGDGDADLLITGYDGSSVHTELYLNDGSGNFVLSISNSFTGMYSGDIELFDADNDTDLDIIVSGSLLGFQTITEVYLNDGVANYSLVQNCGILVLGETQLAISDFNSDGFLDVVIDGDAGGSLDWVTRIYEGNGDGTFTENITSNLPNIINANIGVADVDNDGDIDVFLSGYVENGMFLNPFTNLFFNDGQSQFTEYTLGTFNISKSAIGFYDDQLDGDLDILLIGVTPGGLSTMSYQNNGNGTFVNGFSEDVAPYDNARIKVADINSDGRDDVMVIGGENQSPIFTKLYYGNTFGNLKLVDGSGIDGYRGSSVKSYFGDVDLDGDLDLLSIGFKENVVGSDYELYKNNGVGNYTNQGAPGLSQYPQDGALADVTGDGYLDAIVANGPSLAYTTNDGFGFFNGPLNVIASNIWNSSDVRVFVEDLDQDGDLDIVHTGDHVDYHTEVYLNDGVGNFTELLTAGLDNLLIEDMDLNDIDGDGDIDLIMMSSDSVWNPKSQIYFNDGLGNFTLSSNALHGVWAGECRLMDFDNDNDLDALFFGRSPNTPYMRVSYLYINNGSGVMTENTGQVLPKLMYPRLDLLDFDTDGNMDYVISGVDTNGVYSIQLNRNSGNGDFQNIGTPGIANYISAPFVADVDGDLDPDILFQGEYAASMQMSHVYRNNSCPSTTFANQEIESCSLFIGPSGTVYSSSGTFIDTIPNSTGCDSLITMNIDITIIDTLVYESNGNLMSNQQSGLFQWMNCIVDTILPNENNATFTPSVNGTYALIIIDGSCTDTSDCYVVDYVSIPDVLLDDRINVYPNPTNSIINIEFDYGVADCLVNIQDLNGRSVFSKKYSHTNYINESIDFKPGTYFVEITIGSEIKRFRVIKN